ncbi:putative ATP-dependent RNA helicase DHR1 [Coemansia sp. RSA 989]|nr:P-loop containing nucleoside triphosphate hydrolase protein [Coemansia mojavensis]KAJ1742737.1 putative ATP-dependent RNA helicase DHR1 [Coemansia sp. RSA 1086]KAJ1751348.1 putative ATP-dependent RNA helicase DHR1 [Coemansia sp. RSA 1821]KAJ1865859.1 putative ATP-dependent RNA helicase DHR1 [Coemansia sp. RSA 989]KAJ1873112.1 putative ATP-dependent RNA helicase DHR1 [Coemansia sp. RSA 990]KAJ2669887.1 putative ATP-dependent RNA helicase DHR1 [Coemansia sp. RSA 1085]
MGTNKSKKQKRFEKFVEKQVKKEERVSLLEKLSTSTWKSSLMRSSKTLGRSDTRREKLQRALTEEKLGLARSDPSVRLYVSERDPEEVRVLADAMPMVKVSNGSEQQPTGKKRKRNKNKQAQASELSEPALPENKEVKSEDEPKPLEPVAGSGLATATIVKRKRQKKGRVLARLGLVEARESSSSESEFDSSASEDEGSISSQVQIDEPEKEETHAESSAETASVKHAEPQIQDQPKTFYTGSMLKPLLAKRGQINTDSSQDNAKAYYVPVERPESIQAQRIQLPVYAEEQQIMEAIAENPVVVLSGETGSGKTTQVPQFLLEAGYGDASSPNPGIIGITQPRRVAAISMAHRVAEELGNFGHTVAHQVRFDTTVSNTTRVKFMTEGVLLRELANDLLLTKYSVIIADEAHERSLNTDILLGVLSRVVRLRMKLSTENPDKHRPLRLVIMSATLRVDDFVKNPRLFKVPPPVINVQSRQHPVRVHFNRRTPAPGQHVSEAIRKVAKIHRRLPDGGILVFLTGQAEITYMCRQLQKQFPMASDAPVVPDKLNTANGMQTHVEDEDIDIGDCDTFTDDDELHDDFASDSEEEDEIVVGGSDEADDKSTAEEREILLSENLKTAVDSDETRPLYVLPLYSMLPAEQQLKVFAPPPSGSRLCVVATNVAETSITIPGIRYVVDAGMVKEKTYDSQTQVQSFEVGWTSQASANQRMGRAGRTGPGHCYRLFSSAVFNDQFTLFSEPEVLRMPIEGVVLQMKAMNMDNVTNFPFPTPPRREALQKSERLLTWLGALDAKGRVTDLGRLMAVFPVAPRFAKMLIIGQQHGCLPYVIAIVAALSVGDPFVKEFNIGSDMPEDADNLSFEEEVAASETKNLTNAEMAAKEQRRAQRRKYWDMQAKLAGADPTSDILKWLTAIGAFEYSGGSDAVCQQYFVRFKAMNEIRKLRRQLTNLVQMYCPGADVSMDPRMPPPSRLQQSVLRQIILAGFMDQVAVRGDIAGYHDPDGDAAAKRRGLHAEPYMTMWSDEPVYIHPESSIYSTARDTGMPQAIVYSELQRTSRLWAKAVTVVTPKWLATIGQPLCTFGNPLTYPLPKYNDARDEMTCYVEPRFGPRSWLLSMVKVQQRRVGTRWQITNVIG